MNIQAIKSLLKANKQNLFGKRLEVNGQVYSTLKSFGEAILKLSTTDNISLSMMCYLNNTERCLSNEYSLGYCLSSERFDTIKVHAVNTLNNVNLDYSNVDFKSFGTTA